MIETLIEASNSLHQALDQYLCVCSTIQNSFIGNTNKSLPEDLVNRIKLEVQLLLNYESKFQDAKSAISWARSSSALAPASTLPPEILIRIFHSVLSGEQCSQKSENGSEIAYSKYPERLSHVCSRWRQIALSSRNLWVHIDLSPYRLLNQGLIPRAKAYAERSGHLPLLLHIHGPTHRRFGTPDDPGPIGFVASVAVRTGSLDLDIGRHRGEFYHGVLQACLKGCVPGVLTRFFVREANSPNGSPYSRTIMAKDGEPLGDKFYAQPLLIDSTEEHLAKVLSRLTTLSLDGMLVSWTSKTYSSLVELRLFCSYHRTPSFISEAQFHSVLKSCPQLRILEFSLSISKASDTGPDEPIPLNKLHTLVLGGGVYHWKPFLRAIAPGPNPLHLLMPWEDNEKWAGGRSYPIPDELTNFLARSSVTRLTLKSLKTCYQIFRLLRFTASVQKLALDEAYWEEPFTGEIDPSGLDTRVNTLYLLRSNVHMDGLRKLVKILNIQKLVCWGDCFISSQKGFTPVVRGRSVHREIEMLCPMVEFLDGSYPNPMGSRY